MIMKHVSQVLMLAHVMGALPPTAAGYPLKEAEKSSKELTVQSFSGEAALLQDASSILFL